MFFIWDTGSGKSDESSIGMHECEVCNNQIPFNATIYYRYFHFWYIFSFLTSCKYVYECSHCHNGYYVNATEFKKNIPKNHIPFIRKYGWLVCVSIIAILIGIGAIAGNKHNNQIQSYINTPLVNDLYLVDLAKIQDSGYDKTKHAYGIMKLAKITEDNKYYFFVSLHAYNKKRGVNEMVKKPGAIDFDSEDGITFTWEELKSLKSTDVIFDIIR